jgi:RNA-directed DNA polymerase
MSSLKKWQKHFEDFGVRQELIVVYMRYVERMLNAQLPIIFELQHLASLLGRTRKYLSSVINCPDAHYRIFKIPKRRGGFRTISAPYPALLECQQWINKYILSAIKVHPAAHGFIQDRSIITNAKEHLAKPCLLRMDLENFFTSITIRRVISVFRQLGYPENVSFYLARLCCSHEVLPQGAATSPALSNIIARKLDSRLHGLAMKFDLQYTRYADDMVFSGDRIPKYFQQIVEDIAKEEEFRINHNKTLLAADNSRRVVTGLSVSGQTLKIPKGYKRKLRQEVHYILSFGYFSHTSKLKIRNPFYIDSVYGKLIFWQSVEPNNSYVNRALPLINELRRSANFGGAQSGDLDKSSGRPTSR